MKQEINPIKKTTNDVRYIYKVDYRERRRLEMKRRMGLLHHKRARLERELKDIKMALIALDQQMQRDVENEKLLRT